MLFHSIRMRLTVWYSAVLFAGLLLLGLSLWVVVRHYLLSGVEERLEEGARGLRAVLEHEADHSDFLEELEEYARAAPGGALLSVRDSSGAELLPGTLLQSSSGDRGIALINGDLYRTYSERVSVRGRSFDITSAASLSDVQRMLA